jgi:N-acetylglucosamine kinase
VNSRRKRLKSIREANLKICADVGGTFVTLALVDGAGAISSRRRLATPADDWTAFVDVFRSFVAIHGGSVDSRAPLSIALSGFVDPAQGAVTSANVRCVGGRRLAVELATALERPVIVTNDADCFALAEARLGAGRGHDRVFGVILGTGVGGGLVQDGRSLTGARGISGEWGHGPIVTRSRTDPAATPYFPCGCGRWGCLDTVGAARGMERLHAWLHGERAHSREITGQWEAGDAGATATIDLYLELVAGPLAIILNTWAADIAPVGGGLSSCAPLVRELDLQVRRRMLAAPPDPLLVRASLGADAGLLGAALMADDRTSAG